MGEELFKALVNGFMEIKECGRLSDVKEDRKLSVRVFSKCTTK
jgi:hypothetical protein